MQAAPVTLSKTDAFRESRKLAGVKRAQDMKSQLAKLLPSVERLADSETQFDPIANFDSWNPLKKLVISNKETWSACGECGEYALTSNSAAHFLTTHSGISTCWR